MSEDARTELASNHGMSSEDADLFLTSDDPDLLARQAERWGSLGLNTPMSNYVPSEGSNPWGNQLPDTLEEILRQKLGGF